MNLLLFRSEELREGQRLHLRDRRLTHLHGVLKSQVGDTLRVGEIDGRVGTGRVEVLTRDHAELRIHLYSAPPTALDVTVVLALPRPKMLRRILRGIAEVGVKELHLIHSYRVEKSYWQSPLLGPQALEAALLSGLEQARDTHLPRITLHRRFRPFAEDTLPGLCAGRDAMLADAAADTPYPTAVRGPALLIIGPEGGFIPFEVELLRAAGARGVSLGPRILRVETALISALARHAVADDG